MQLYNSFILLRLSPREATFLGVYYPGASLFYYRR